MNKIEKLGWTDLDTISIPNFDPTVVTGRKSVPDLTRDNLIAVIHKQNEIIDFLNKLNKEVDNG